MLRKISILVWVLVSLAYGETMFVQQPKKPAVHTYDKKDGTNYYTESARNPLSKNLTRTLAGEPPPDSKKIESPVGYQPNQPEKIPDAYRYGSPFNEKNLKEPLKSGNLTVLFGWVMKQISKLFSN